MIGIRKEVRKTNIEVIKIKTEIVVRKTKIGVTDINQAAMGTKNHLKNIHHHHQKIKNINLRTGTKTVNVIKIATGVIKTNIVVAKTSTPVLVQRISIGKQILFKLFY